MMDVVQVLPTFAGKDAIGNETSIFAHALVGHGYGSGIVAEWFSKEARDAVPVECYGNVSDVPADTLLYHHSIDCSLASQFAQSNARRILRYHNVTPPEFFSAFDPAIARRCRRGLDQVASLSGDVDFCLAASEFNKRDLIEMGYTCPIEVLPVAIPFEDYAREPDQRLLSKLEAEQGTKILFVGRIAPNKCQHDVIKAFWLYKRRYDPDAKLYLVGGYSIYDRYYASLVEYVGALGLADVVFAGSVPFPQLIAYYRASDVFLCQSEHEGFCVPLVESMFFDLPVIAYDAAAVGETLGPGALKLPTKNPEIVAGAIHALMVDEELCRKVLDAQRDRLVAFDTDTVRQRLLEILDSTHGC